MEKTAALKTHVRRRASSARTIASSRASISSSRSLPCCSGRALSLVMRFHLIYPQAQVAGDVMTPEFYLSLLTLHGTIMVFFVLTLAPLNAFGNLVLPEQLGRDAAWHFRA